MAEPAYHDSCCGVTWIKSTGCGRTVAAAEESLRKGCRRYVFMKGDIYDYKASQQYWFKLPNTRRTRLQPVLEDLGFKQVAENARQTIWVKVG